MSSKDFVSSRKQKKRPYRTRHGSHMKINTADVKIPPHHHYHQPPSHHHNHSIFTIPNNNNNSSNLNNMKPLKPNKAHSRTLSYIKSNNTNNNNNNNNHNSNPRRNGHKHNHRNYRHSNQHTQHKIDSPLTPIKIQPTFTSPLPSPETEVSPIVSPVASPIRSAAVIPKKKRQNVSFLSFSPVTQNLSVSLPSSPVGSIKSCSNPSPQSLNSAVVSFKHQNQPHLRGQSSSSNKRERVKQGRPHKVNNHETVSMNKMQKFSSLNTIDDTSKRNNLRSKSCNNRSKGRPRSGTGPRSRSSSNNTASIRKYRDNNNKNESNTPRMLKMERDENGTEMKHDKSVSYHPFLANTTAMMLTSGIDQQENIRVMVRFRPFNKTELRYDEKYLHSRFDSPTTRSLEQFSHDINFINGNTKIKMNYFCGSKKAKETGKNYRSYSFKFDQIFENNTTQKEIFDTVAKPICDDILQFKSNNATIFCYGQSGSGKTHTMFGSAQV